jgi:hypothetical protein
MIPDPDRRGQALAAFFFAVAPRLLADLEESGLVPLEPPEARRRVALEWESFALYACVRGLVAAGGFNRETAQAIDALHRAVLERWLAESSSLEAFEARRAALAPRYEEYGRIGQEGGAAGAGSVTARLGEAAALHIGAGTPSADLARLVGGLHEALAEGGAEAVRSAE